MSKTQESKKLVRELYRELDQGGVDAFATKLLALTAPDYQWRGFHPFNELTGASAVVEKFYQPLCRAFSSITRRQDVFFAGHNMFSEDEIWVCSMGHFMGLFDQPLLSIQPTSRIAMLRYCEFNLISNGKILQTAMYFDLPHLMAQAGQYPFPQQSGAQLVQPGPATHDGLLFDPQPIEEGQKTLEVIGKMVGDLGQWQSGLPLEEELARTWHDDMLWWGPTGIGATYTIPRYAKQHSGIFRKSFTNRSKTKHVCRIAEGHYGGFFGWPNFTAEHVGGFMGMPAFEKPVEFRVIDIYRRADDKLAENWIFIDLLHILKQAGIDVLARHGEMNTCA
jgi:predicted ester cyclase